MYVWPSTGLSSFLLQLCEIVLVFWRIASASIAFFFSFLNLTLPLCVCHACISDQQLLNPHPAIFILYLIANPSSIPSVSSQHQQHLLFDCVLPLTCPPFYSERELVLVKSHSRIVTYLKLLIKPAIFERLHNRATSL